MGHYLKMNITVSEEYIQGFTRANNTFLYQLVFDPIKRKLVPLNDYADDVDPETLIYAGRYPFGIETEKIPCDQLWCLVLFFTAPLLLVKSCFFCNIVNYRGFFFFFLSTVDN